MMNIQPETPILWCEYLSKYERKKMLVSSVFLCIRVRLFSMINEKKQTFLEFNFVIRMKVSETLQV